VSFTQCVADVCVRHIRLSLRVLDPVLMWALILATACVAYEPRFRPSATSIT